MPYKPIDIPRFGGLDLRRDPEEDQGGARAIDLRDVEFDMDGRVRMRAGTNILTSVSGTTYQNLIPFTSSVLGANSQVITINASTGQLSSFDAVTGTLIDTHTPTAPSLPAYIYSGVQIGTPTGASTMYLMGADWDFMVTYDGTTFTNSGVIYGGYRYLAVQYPDNRMVIGVLNSAPNYSRVFFSQPNDPTNWGVDDYVDLMPGDGEQIVGMANFREYLFVFKQSSFFVFYGNSTDATGGTVFNYRTVRHGLGTRNSFGTKTVVAGREGVYFLGADGVYLTDGGFPRKISGPLDPIFENATDPLGYFTSFDTAGSVGIYIATLAYVGGRLYMTTSGGQVSGRTARVFVYDPRLDAWTFWRMLDTRTSNVLTVAPVSVYGTGAIEEKPYFLFTTVSGVTIRSIISYLDPSMIHDEDYSGTLIGVTGSYRTNFMDFGEAGTMKTIREVLVDGYFNAGSLNVYSNNARSVGAAATSGGLTTSPSGTGSTLTWPNYALGQTRLRESIRGQNFSFEVSSNAGWSLHRLVPHMRNVRPAGPRMVAP